MPSRKYTLRLPPALDTAVQAHLHATHQGFADLMRDALMAYLGLSAATPLPGADTLTRLETLEVQVAALTARMDTPPTPQQTSEPTPEPTPAPIPADRRASRERSPADTPRKGGRPRSAVGQQILARLAAHPEGLTAEQLRGALTPGKGIGDILAGMRRTGAVRARKEGRGWRYFLATTA